ncbi:type IV secretory system conjugative DNA transfer family protein [Bosea sp. (in: a-proteobacteria)]|jgi:type IV secretion system protein VirD4|uniref:type IV secretory system conjugative DNA transfer family protein n=1 Tax=Bosea sp. (in: a-proteobacteria) TaxID=1871050 RepID=UPI0035621DB4
MSKRGRRLIGLTFDGRPIFEPSPSASGIITAAMGGGKTTCGSVPAVQSLLSDKGQAIFINDVKDGEIAAQIAQMCRKYGRKFGVVDEFGVLGADYPYRIELNPFDAAQDALRNTPALMPFVLESINHTLIEEPAGDQRNFYWRESPRDVLLAAQKILKEHQPRLLTPGGLQSLLSDPRSWDAALAVEAADDESEAQGNALRLLALKKDNAEHYTQHLNAAITALKIFSFGPLRDAGRQTTHTYAELIRDGWVVCFVNPIRLADRLGPLFALHTLSVMQAGLSKIGRACLILDEFCNAPLREAVSRITVFRAYGIKCLYITQSRQDAVRKYGEREIAILEENCAVKQWFKFSNFEEAERVSRAMGETRNVSHSLGLNSEQMGYSGTLNTGKDRLFTPYELMSLPADEQIVHIADVGFIHCRKIRQNEIAPYCYDLADNPLEGGRLTPDPKVTLRTNFGDQP